MKNQKKQNKFLKIFTSFLFVVLMAVCALVIFFNVTHEYYVVYGPSMTPTLNDGVIDGEQSKDAVFISTIKGFGRGDIIVANKNYGIEGLKEKCVIKRIIALGGDKLKVDIIDGQERIVIIKFGESQANVLEETYLPDYSINEGLKQRFENLIQYNSYNLDENGFITIENDHVFYMGDNRQNSTDSMSYGAMHKKSIIGKVDYIIYNNSNIVGQLFAQIFGW